MRKACGDRIALRFPRDKLSSRTPAKVRSELLDVLIKLEELEIVENVTENQAALIVERDARTLTDSMRQSLPISSMVCMCLPAVLTCCCKE